MAIRMPTKPTTMPIFWRGRSRSLISNGAMAAVSSGCSPAMIPESPAGTPCPIAHQTPAR